MCRLAAWIGGPKPLEALIIKPAHSLLEQSQDATEAKFAVNGDGFGIAWYMPNRSEPGVYRDSLPAWSDTNLASLCQMIEAPLFLAHVRAATGGGTSRENCHPFAHGTWTFMHNGQLGAFARRRRALEHLLPDALFEQRKGSSDSELLFLLLLSLGLKVDPTGAVEQMLELLAASRRQEDGPDRVTCVFSDGKTLFAFRYASDEKCPTLYQRRAEDGTVLASEPLDGEIDGWCAIPPGHLVKISQDKSHLTSLDLILAAA